MNKFKTLLILTGGVLLTSCGSMKKKSAMTETNSDRMMTNTIMAKSGTATQGTVNFKQENGMVTMDMNAYKLKPGTHAVHIHEFGDCSAADGTSTGGHWNPAKDDHGKWGAEHFHMGDIGNLVADNKGVARLIFKTDKWCVGCSDESKNIVGKSIIIHAGKDDFKTQPTGNAGGRVGCVEIK